MTSSFEFQKFNAQQIWKQSTFDSKIRIQVQRSIVSVKSEKLKVFFFFYLLKPRGQNFQKCNTSYSNCP